jgi:hypothetical protein
MKQEIARGDEKGVERGEGKRVMKRVWLLAGIVVGFVVGSSMGREAYERLQGTVRSLGRRPETRMVMDSLISAASDISDTTADSITQAKDKVQAKVSSAVS